MPVVTGRRNLPIETSSPKFTIFTPYQPIFQMSNQVRFSFLLGYVCLLFACSNDAQNASKAGFSESMEQPFSLLSSDQTNIHFHNKITETKEYNHLLWEAIYNGGGVAIGDLNNDDLPDVFFTGNQVSDALYLNKGSFEFEDISVSSGINSKESWSTGVVMVDVNGDGWLDIYVSRSWWDMDAGNAEKRANLLWINNRNLTFTESAKAYGLDDSGYSTQANFFDYDLDGDLDCYVLNTPSHNFNQKLQYAQNQAFPYEVSDHLYRNDQNKFIDVTKESGIESYPYGLGIVSLDINFDAFPDLYIANDFEKPDRFLINNRDGTFKDEIHERMKHISLFSMGVDAADFNQDGFLDIAVLDMQTADHYRAKTNMKSMNVTEFWRNVRKGYHYQYMSNMLQMNRGAGFFSEIGQFAGMAKTDWSWSILMADLDNDTRTDIFVTNGINKDIRNNDFLKKAEANSEGDLFQKSSAAPSQPLPNFAFKNNGDLTFEDVSESWNLNQKSFSHGAAYADLDLDGDLDLVVNNTSEKAFIYRNNSNSNYLRIKILGWGNNPRGLGTKAIVHHGDTKQYQDLTNVRGFQSSSEAVFHFGLGDYEKADTVFVIFSDGKMHRLENVKANQYLILDYAKANDLVKALPSKKTIFTKLSAPQTGIDFKHVENGFNDFEREILLPHKQSTKGPFISVGDVNDDNLDDFFVGGASGQSGKLFIQKKDGSFQKKENQPWEMDSEKEDIGSVFVDFENDGDLDLLVASGGSEFDSPNKHYNNRLYLNDGNGTFSATSSIFSDQKVNSSCVVVGFDDEKTPDIFIGGSVRPGAYPKNEPSEWFINDSGEYLEFSGGLKDIGMVTDAVWADFDGDKMQDLIVVGEWMYPVFFKRLGKKHFEKVEIISKEKTGWWQSIVSEDIDNDGDMDLICGNVGMNNKYRASAKKPLLVYGNDFDNNETNDIVLAKTSEFGTLPVRGRECSSEQMPFISEKFPTYDAFAKATLTDILGETGLENAIHREVREFQSGVFRNDGGNFEFIPFPNLAQIAPVMDMLAIDLNKDGLKDLILAGNLFNAEVETVRHDANNGLVLINKGNAQFEPMTMLESGLYLPGNVKSLAKVKTQKGTLILAGVNDNILEVFRIDK